MSSEWWWEGGVLDEWIGGCVERWKDIEWGRGCLVALRLQARGCVEKRIVGIMDS